MPENASLKFICCNTSNSFGRRNLLDLNFCQGSMTLHPASSFPFLLWAAAHQSSGKAFCHGYFA